MYGLWLEKEVGPLHNTEYWTDIFAQLQTYACKDTPTLVKSKIIVGQIAVRGGEWVAERLRGG